jgi:hypothetical protein
MVVLKITKSLFLFVLWLDLQKSMYNKSVTYVIV